MYENKKTFESILVLIVDLCSLIVSMGIAFWIRYGIFYGRFEHGDQIWLLLFAIALYGLIFVLLDFSHHFFRRGMFDEFVNVVKSELIFSAVLIMALFVMHRSADLSRLVFGYQIVINTFMMYAARVIFKQYMVKVYRNSRHSNRLLVVTSSDQAGDVIENLKEYNEWNRTIAGLVLTDEAKVEEIGEIPVVAHREDFLNYVIRNDVDEVFIIDDKLMRTPLMNEWVRELEQMGIIVDVNIDAFDLSVSGKKSLNRVGKYAAVTFARNLFSTRQMIAKRALDIVGSMVGMIILGIATIFVAPAIKLDSPGPVFFGQTRVGKNGRKFTYYKFRSMYMDADKRITEYKKLNQYTESIAEEAVASSATSVNSQKQASFFKDDEQNIILYSDNDATPENDYLKVKRHERSNAFIKLENDPRITKIGQIIRKYSIDELPQLFNILNGDMSIVGNRPLPVYEAELLTSDEYIQRFMAPAGLTGLWQVEKRGNSGSMSAEERKQLDIKYAHTFSFWLDMKIIIKTFTAFVQKEDV